MARPSACCLCARLPALRLPPCLGACHGLDGGDPVDFDQPGEHRGDLVVDDLVSEDVELGEDGLVEQPSSLSAEPSVQLVGLFQQCQALGKPLGADLHVGTGFGEGCFEFSSLVGDAEQSFPNRFLGQVTVGGQIEQVGFLNVELGLLGAELLLEELTGLAVIPQDLIDQLAHSLDEFRLELHAPVVLGDGFLHRVDGGVGHGTEVVLLGSTEEVEVRPTGLAGSPLHDHPGFSSLPVAGPAPQGALEVVVVDPAPFGGGPSGVEHFLDSGEQFFVHQGLVASGVHAALVGDETQVVRVGQHAAELGGGDRTGWVPAWSGLESSLGQFGLEVSQGVVAGGVQLERQPDERGSFLVQGHRAYLTTFEAFSDVEVAERGEAEGAAPLGLLAHLVTDVCTVSGRAELVEARQNTVHELAFWGGVDHLGGRDKGGAVLAKLHHDQGVIDPVPV